MLAAIVKQLLLRFLRGLKAGLEHHERLHLLHLERIRHADDAAHVHRVMRIKDVLDLGGIHVVAARDDHALDALAEINEAVLVHLAEVARVHPGHAVRMGAQRVRRLLRVADVFHHHRGAGKADFALLAIGEFFLRADADDLVERIRERDADAPLAGHMVRREAARGDALRGAIALADFDGGLMILQEFVKTFLELHGKRIAAGEHALQAGKVKILQPRDAQQRLIERRHARDEVGLVLSEQLRVGLRREARDQDAAAAVDEHGMDAHAKAEAMEHGHDGKHLVARLEHGVRGDDLRAEGVEIAVGKQDALRHAGGAAAVKDDGAVLRLARADIVAVELLAALQEILPEDDGRILGHGRELAPFGELVAHLHDGVQRVRNARDDEVRQVDVRADGRKLAVKLIQRDRSNAAGLAEVEFDLALA